MDIRQLQYFVEIVKSDFNLSLAAKRLYISQPALSQFIKSFEESENIYLFERYKGRLQGLTPTGEEFYANVKSILEQYDKMMVSLRDDSVRLKGKVIIGIPPLILGLVFSDVMAQLIIEHPDIEIEIVEKGAYELSKLFILGELDYAVLLNPTKINPAIVDEHTLQVDEVTAFFNRHHPLAKKKKLHWSDLNNEILAIFKPGFIIHHMLMKKFLEEDIKPKRYTMSSSWDFLLLLANSSNFITILPSPVHNFYKNKQIIEKPFHDPLSWNIVLCRPKKERYNQVNQFVLDYIIDYFAQKAAPLCK